MPKRPTPTHLAAKTEPVLSEERYARLLEDVQRLNIDYPSRDAGGGYTLETSLRA